MEPKACRFGTADDNLRGYKETAFIILGLPPSSFFFSSLLFPCSPAPFPSMSYVYQRLFPSHDVLEHSCSLTAKQALGSLLYAEISEM